MYMKKKCLFAAVFLAAVFVFTSCFNVLNLSRKPVFVHISLPGSGVAREVIGEGSTGSTGEGSSSSSSEVGHYSKDSLKYCLLYVMQDGQVIQKIDAELDKEVVVEVMSGVEYTFCAEAYNNEDVLIADSYVTQKFALSDEEPTVVMTFNPREFQFIELNLRPYVGVLQNCKAIDIYRKDASAGDETYICWMTYVSEAEYLDCNVSLPDYFTEPGKKYTYKIEDNANDEDPLVFISRTADRGLGELKLNPGKASVTDDIVKFTSVPFFSLSNGMSLEEQYVIPAEYFQWRVDYRGAGGIEGNPLSFIDDELYDGNTLPLINLTLQYHLSSGTYVNPQLSGTVFIPKLHCNGYAYYRVEPDSTPTGTDGFPAEIAIKSVNSFNLSDYEDSLRTCSWLKLYRRSGSSEYEEIARYTPSDGMKYIDSNITIYDMFAVAGTTYDYKIAYYDAATGTTEYLPLLNDCLTAGTGLGDLSVKPGRASVDGDYIWFDQIPTLNLSGLADSGYTRIIYQDEEGNDMLALDTRYINPDGAFPFYYAESMGGSSFDGHTLHAARYEYYYYMPTYNGCELYYLANIPVSAGEGMPYITFESAPSGTGDVISLTEYASQLSGCMQYTIYRKQSGAAESDWEPVYELDTDISEIAAQIPFTDLFADRGTTYEYELRYNGGASVISLGDRTSQTGVGEFKINHVTPSYNSSNQSLDFNPAPSISDGLYGALEALLEAAEEDGESWDFELSLVYETASHDKVNIPVNLESSINLKNIYCGDEFVGQTVSPLYYEFKYSIDEEYCSVSYLRRIPVTGYPSFTIPEQTSGSGDPDLSGYISIDLSVLRTDPGFDPREMVMISRKRTDDFSGDYEPIMIYEPSDGAELDLDVKLPDYFSQPNTQYMYKIEYSSSGITAYKEVQYQGTYGLGVMTIDTGAATYDSANWNLDFARRPSYYPDIDALGADKPEVDFRLEYISDRDTYSMSFDLDSNNDMTMSILDACKSDPPEGTHFSPKSCILDLVWKNIGWNCTLTYTFSTVEVQFLPDIVWP